MQEAARSNHLESGIQDQYQYLTFMLGGKKYGLEILNVREIISYGEVTELPMMPDFIAGVINLRGSVVPIIDFSLRLSGTSITFSKRTSIIILDIDNEDISVQLGIIVDTVQEVLDVQSDAIEATPSLGENIESAFISGMAKVDNQLLVLLNIEKILSVDELSLAGSMPASIQDE